ncbi:MAG: DNA pilot protein [Microviridae sp.]|nr:MAG: DNA pilot protein [Microviridae sp.]
MADFLGSIVKGVFDTVGTLQKNLANRKQADKANAWNMAEAQKQMDFQERMSNTAYQRGIKDMQAAGLNPMLAYSQGGASAPSGSMATATVPQQESSIAAGANGAVQGMQLMQGVQQIAQSEAQTKQLEAAAEELKGRTLDRNVTTARQLKELEGMGFDVGIKEFEQWLKNSTREYQAKEIMAKGDIAENEAKKSERTWRADVEQRKAQSRLTQLDLPQAEGGAKFYEKVEGMPMLIKMLLQLMQAGSSARSALGR